MTSFNPPLVIGERSVSKLLEEGFSNGFVVKNDTVLRVIITAGNFEANGKIYVLNADTTHTLTSLASAQDFHYIYIDDSASSGSTPTFIDSTTEPVFDTVKLGWYNGDNRLVGVVFSEDGLTAVQPFTASGRNNTIDFRIGPTTLIAANMNPTGVWQTPNVNDGSVITPVNAETLFLRAGAEDAGAKCSFFMTPVELGTLGGGTGETAQVNVFGFDQAVFPTQVGLGPTRNVFIAGEADDDNLLTAHMIGFQYTR